LGVAHSHRHVSRVAACECLSDQQVGQSTNSLQLNASVKRAGATVVAFV
jgi:hypothetical protein